MAVPLKKVTPESLLADINSSSTISVPQKNPVTSPTPSPIKKVTPESLLADINTAPTGATAPEATGYFDKFKSLLGKVNSYIPQSAKDLRASDAAAYQQNTYQPDGVPTTPVNTSGLAGKLFPSLNQPITPERKPIPTGINPELFQQLKGKGISDTAIQKLAQTPTPFRTELGRVAGETITGLGTEIAKTPGRIMRAGEALAALPALGTVPSLALQKKEPILKTFGDFLNFEKDILTGKTSPVIEAGKDIAKSNIPMPLKIVALTGAGTAQVLGNPALWIPYGKVIERISGVITGGSEAAFTLLNDARNILGVAESSTPSQIKAAYKVAAFKTHPDIAGGSEEAFAKVNDAYELLTHKPAPQKDIFSRIENLFKGKKKLQLPSPTPEATTEDIRSSFVKMVEKQNAAPKPVAPSPVTLPTPEPSPTPLLKAPENSIQLPITEQQKLLAQTSQVPKATTITGEGFTMSAKPNKEAVKISKALSDYRSALDKFTIKPTEKNRITAQELLAKYKTLSQKVTPTAPVAEGNGIQEGNVPRTDIVDVKPSLNLKRNVTVTTVNGEKAVISEGEALSAYELKGGKILLKDGKEYIVSKNQYQNIKGNSVSGEAKPFAPELKGTEETVKGAGSWQGDNYVADGKTVANLVKNEDGTWSYQSDFSEGSDTFKTRQEAMDAALDEITDPYAEKGTKFSQYQLPGGTNYKEVLIKAPNKYERGDFSIKEVPTDKHPYHAYRGNELLDRYDTAKEAENAISNHIRDFTKGEDFKSSHWDEPNVISHLRLNERTYQGKKVTFMEELQSDWAREGRSKGFAEDIKIDWQKSPSGDLNATIQGKDLTITKEGSKAYVYEKGGALGQTAPNIDSAKRIAENYLRQNSSNIPNNPLLKNWQELSVKRALKEAVDDNSEYLAWTTGEQQAARYNLSKEINTIEWKPNGYSGIIEVRIEPKTGEFMNLKVEPETGKVHSAPGSMNAVGKPLSEVVGKGISEKILAEPKGNLSGEGLNIGGEWAKNLYDKQVKNIVEDVTGGKVEVIDLGLPIEAKEDNTFFVAKTEYGHYNDKTIGADLAQKELTKGNIKIGQLIKQGKVGGKSYIITDILGDGKFKAVPKTIWDNAKSRDVVVVNGLADNIGTQIGRENFWKRHGKLPDDYFIKELERKTETFDISTKKSTGQQAIKITPEIRALVKGEAPVLKKPSGKSPYETKAKLADQVKRIQEAKGTIPHLTTAEQPATMGAGTETNRVIPPSATGPLPAEKGGVVVPEKPIGSFPKVQEIVNGKTSKIAKDINEKSVEAGLTKGFSHLAQYSPVNIAEKSKWATDLVNSDIEKVRTILRGEDTSLTDVEGTALITAVEEYLLKNPNADVAYELANSPLVSGTSAAAQVLRLTAERNPDSVASMLEGIRKAREKSAGRGDIQKTRTTARKQLKSEMDKVNLPKEELVWDKFLDSIVC